MEPIKKLREDNEGVISLLKEIFKEFSFSINLFVVRDGEGALNYLLENENLINKTSPDVVLLDKNLPSNNCLEVFSEIRSDKSLWSLFVERLSISISKEEKTSSFVKKAEFFISKFCGFDRFNDLSIP